VRFRGRLLPVPLAVLIASQRRAERGEATPTDLYLLLGVAWAGGVGFGTFISLTSGDWVAATLGLPLGCGDGRRHLLPQFRRAAHGRADDHPDARGLLLRRALPRGTDDADRVHADPVLSVQHDHGAAYKLNAMLVSTMRAERENEFHARHDMLTGLSNRAGLAKAFGTAGEMRPRGASP
jgi:hypothetical protein